MRLDAASARHGDGLLRARLFEVYPFKHHFPQRMALDVAENEGLSQAEIAESDRSDGQVLPSGTRQPPCLPNSWNTADANTRREVLARCEVLARRAHARRSVDASRYPVFSPSDSVITALSQNTFSSSSSSSPLIVCGPL
jgi:hypothetical protein